MKELKLIMIILVLSLPAGCTWFVWRAYEDGRILAPSRVPIEQQISQAAHMATAMYLFKIGLIILLLFALFGAVLRWLIVPAQRAQMIYPDERGNWPMLQSKYKAKDGTTYDIIHNENLSAGPGTIWAKNGNVRYAGTFDTVSPEQFRYAGQGWAHQTAQADSSGGKITADAMRELEGRSPEQIERERLRADRERVNLELAERRLQNANSHREPLPALPTIKRTVDIADAFAKADDTRFPLGYTDDGQVVFWDVEQSPHVRVHGKTQGSGKTNLIKTIASAALRAGHAVIVLDRRGFKDWSDFADCVELIDNRKSGVFAAVAWQLESFYQERDERLGAAGVGNLAALNGADRRVFVVVSEFGTACRNQEEHHLESAVNSLKNIFSEAGATGMHLVFEDQIVNRSWPRELRGNADPITGYLPEDASKGGGYAKAYELEPFQFHYEGERFRTWDMKRSAVRLLVKVPPLQERIIDLDMVRSVVRSAEENEKIPQTTAKTFVFPERTNTEPAGPTDLQAAVWQWRDRHPDGTQAQMRRDLESVGLPISKGYASECWHSWKEQH